MGALGLCTIQRGRRAPRCVEGHAAALDLDLWIPRISDLELLTIKVRTRWVLMDVHHIRNGSRTMADITFNHCEGQHSPPPILETTWPVTVCGHPLHGTHGGLYPR